MRILPLVTLSLVIISINASRISFSSVSDKELNTIFLGSKYDTEIAFPAVGTHGNKVLYFDSQGVKAYDQDDKSATTLVGKEDLENDIRQVGFTNGDNLHVVTRTRNKLTMMQIKEEERIEKNYVAPSGMEFKMFWISPDQKNVVAMIGDLVENLEKSSNRFWEVYSLHEQNSLGKIDDIWDGMNHTWSSDGTALATANSNGYIRASKIKDSSLISLEDWLPMKDHAQSRVGWYKDRYVVSASVTGFVFHKDVNSQDITRFDIRQHLGSESFNASTHRNVGIGYAYNATYLVSCNGRHVIVWSMEDSMVHGNTSYTKHAIAECLIYDDLLYVAASNGVFSVRSIPGVEEELSRVDGFGYPMKLQLFREQGLIGVGGESKAMLYNPRTRESMAENSDHTSPVKEMAIGVEQSEGPTQSPNINPTRSPTGTSIMSESSNTPTRSPSESPTKKPTKKPTISPTRSTEIQDSGPKMALIGLGVPASFLACMQILTKYVCCKQEPENKNKPVVNNNYDMNNNRQYVTNGAVGQVNVHVHPGAQAHFGVGGPTGQRAGGTTGQRVQMIES